MDWNRDGVSLGLAVQGIHSYELMEKRVDEIIREAAEGDAPLFLFYAQQGIHYPLEGVPDHYLNKEANAEIDRLQFETRQGAGELTAGLDVTVSNMVNTLKETGLWENTILIVASDNGGCSAHGASNWPLRGGKNQLWEGGIRVPAFIHSPILPREMRGRTFQSFFHTSDWLPTIFGMAGLELPRQADNLDGINQWAEISALEPAPGIRTQILHNLERNPHHGWLFKVALQEGELKMLFGEDDGEHLDPLLGEGADASARTCTLSFNVPKYITLVYNTLQDPGERHNIVEEVHDSHLDHLWQQVDEMSNGAAEPAFVDDNWDKACYRVWSDHGHQLVPWWGDVGLSYYGAGFDWAEEGGEDPRKGAEPEKYDGAHADEDEAWQGTP
mmetsp:Transcript_1658/g.2734  ORF Transcript_1658/g.2734 Transcript_1658/m.2734 type:complete len:386 (-) Transcript_1658:115-1272(-)